MKLQLRAIGHTADIDQLVAAVTDAGLRLVRVHRGLEAREAGAERAYLDLVHADTNTEGSAA